MLMIRTRCVALAACALLGGGCSTAPPEPSAQGPRIYIFDNGTIRGLDPALFGVTRDEIQESDFVNSSYLIVHPQGTLLFDAGAIPDSHFPADGGPATEGIIAADRPLLPQLADAGFSPDEVTWLALSHYHSDHTANANAFANATWIVQRAERDWMFAEEPQGIIQPDSYSALREATTRLLDNEDFDVFGDGSVVVKSAPGHTPGHQVLFVRLANTGPVLLSGDLYHYPEEMTLDRVPTFEFDAEETRRSRARIEAFIRDEGATLWIGHDRATHGGLPRAPAYID